jgi:hypothetical protein
MRWTERPTTCCRSATEPAADQPLVAQRIDGNTAVETTLDYVAQYGQICRRANCADGGAFGIHVESNGLRWKISIECNGMPAGSASAAHRRRGELVSLVLDARVESFWDELGRRFGRDEFSELGIAPWF